MVLVNFVIQLISWSVGLPLTILVIAAMVRGPYRQFPALFLYVVIGFVFTVAGMPLYVSYYLHPDHAMYTRMAQWSFWNDLLLEPLAYALVINLIYASAAHVRSRRVVLMGTIGGATLIAAVSFLIHFKPELKNGVWLAKWTGDLGLFSEILALGLWGLLLSIRGRDPKLLLITGGLGIQFAGEAIGDSVRSIASQWRSHNLAFTGSAITALADLTALYIFWQAFRKRRNGDGNTKARRAVVTEGSQVSGSGSSADPR
jgi:hypothetical protein